MRYINRLFTYLLTYLQVLLAARVYDEVFGYIEMQQRHCQVQPHPVSYPVSKNYSTTLALIEVIDKIYQNQNEGKLCAGVYLDL